MIVVFTVPPARLLTYLAFFAPLWIALASSSAIGAYAIVWRLGNVPDLPSCSRRGALLATFSVANLGLLATHHWSPLILVLSAVALGLSDLGLRRQLR
jgi:hypothetical protein